MKTADCEARVNGNIERARRNRNARSRPNSQSKLMLSRIAAAALVKGYEREPHS
jgi:hypothetical protein